MRPAIKILKTEAHTPTQLGEQVEGESAKEKNMKKDELSKRGRSQSKYIIRMCSKWLVIVTVR